MKRGGKNTEKQRQYLAVDLKSYYASIECIDRGLDPLTTNLVVADESRYLHRSKPEISQAGRGFLRSSSGCSRSRISPARRLTLSSLSHG